MKPPFPTLHPEEEESKRLRQIRALKRAGLATWSEMREETEILRRQVLRGLEE